MKLFTPLYEKVVQWSSKPHAQGYLYGLSFAEAIVVPIPPDILLAPMCATQPHRAIRLGLGTTAFSVLGGVVGYLLGFFIIESIEPWLLELGWHHDYMIMKEWFSRWGIGVILVAGISPIPYKVFTLTAGAMQFSLPLFILFSLLGRGGRFFLVAILLKHAGPVMLPKVHRISEQLGWATVIVFVLLLIYYL